MYFLLWVLEKIAKKNIERTKNNILIYTGCLKKMLHSEIILWGIYLPFYSYYDTWCTYMGYQGMSRYYMNPFLYPYSVPYGPTRPTKEVKINMHLSLCILKLECSILLASI